MTSGSPKALILSLVSAAESDPNLYNEILEARNALSKAILKPNGMATLMESSKNGVSYKVMNDVPESLRLQVLNTALTLIEQGKKPTSVSQARFQ